MVQLRDYQKKALADIHAEFENGAMSVLHQSPTGSGKTREIAFIAREMSALGLKLGIVTHLVDLIPQISKALKDEGVLHGVIAAGYPATGHAVQIISVDTFNARQAIVLHFDLLIIDEAHHVVEHNKWGRMAKRLNTRLLGLTATPVREDNKPLGFDAFVPGPSELQLIEGGYLARPVVFAPPSGVDRKGLKVRGGDYRPEEAEKVVNHARITGCAIEHYRELSVSHFGKLVPAIAFCQTVAHAAAVSQQFHGAGIPAAYIEGRMSRSERADIIRRYATGDILLLAACNLISEGLDLQSIGGAGAWVGAIIMLRLTKSLGLFRQMAGRGMRKEFPEKDFVLMLDHVGNVFEHDLPDVEIDWPSLVKGRQKKSRAPGEATIAVLQCPKCFAAFRPRATCPACGHVFESDAQPLQQVAGKLKKVDKEEVKRRIEERASRIRRARTLEELYELADQMQTKDGSKYKRKWAEAVYASRFGWPALAREKARIKADEAKGVQFRSV